jgi:2-(1,2-epoxy-1,2-dihydrophenyl)acetyl-CoA isomerase
VTAGSDCVRLDRVEGIATITIDRPEKKNAITNPMFSRLRELFEEVAHNPEDRVLVITGVGDAFSAGGSMDRRAAAGRPPRQAPPTPRGPFATEQEMADINAAAIVLHHLRQPTIAAVNGVACGAGWSLALGCDVVLAAESARFSAKFIDVGLSTDFGGTWLLPRAVGLQRAKHLAFTAEFISAAEAKELGAVLEVYPDAELMDAVMAYAKDLASRPAVPLACIKAGMNQALGWTFEEASAYEGHAQGKCGPPNQAG